MNNNHAVFVLAFLGLVSVTQATEPEDWLSRELPGLVSFYEQLHASPELSLAEHKTATKLADAWQDAGFEVTRGVGGTGVVGVLANGDGPTLMLRTDLDALPITEETNLSFASKVRTKDKRGATVGVMHACGHDVHMTSVVGASRFLAANLKLWQGTLVVIAQPAEELGKGAQAMLADGLFARFPRPDMAVALHVAADLAAGQVEVREGFVCANVDSVDITLFGRGGHGSTPHKTIDPIVIAARLVIDLQTIVSREIKPLEPAVVTVGSIHGGTKHNIISDECRLQLTVRSYSPSVRQQLAEAIRRKANAAAVSAGATEPEVVYSEGTPSLYNDPELTKQVAASLRKALGAEAVGKSEPIMGGEDFSRYGQAGVPICMFRLGTIAPNRLKELNQQPGGPPSLHSSKYYPDAEASLETGFESLISVALDCLTAE